MQQEILCLEDEWMDYDLEQDELLSHLDSMCGMTEAGKMTWTLQAYDRPCFFIKNPFVQDIESDISHCCTVEGKCQGRTFIYALREAVRLPSGMCDIEIKEKEPESEYLTSLSFDRDYEYLTSQKQVFGSLF